MWFQQEQGARKIPKGQELYDYMDKKFEAVDKRFESVDKNFKKVFNQLKIMDEKLEEVGNLKHRVDYIENTLNIPY